MAAFVECIQNVPAQEYHSVLALSNSGMKDLSVSPLRYWYRHVNPDGPPADESNETIFGTALHCKVLEPGSFSQRYCRAPQIKDYPGCLVTVEDIRRWITDKGHRPVGTRKNTLIDQALKIDSTVAIWEVITAEHDDVNSSKTSLSEETLARVERAAEALLDEPRLREVLRDGVAEVAIFANDPATGIPMKAKLDWVSVSANCILDLKTFTQRRGKSIDQSVADAIFYEGYYRQAYLYSTLYQQATGSTKRLKSLVAFVESDEPHEVRIKELRSSTRGTMNVYWQRAQLEVRHFCSIWAEYMREFGEKPWRRNQEIELLLDEEMKGMAFS